MHRTLIFAIALASASLPAALARAGASALPLVVSPDWLAAHRSEERRVGKEC